MNFDIGNILTNSWQITWKHKSILGLMLAPLLIGFLPILFLIILFSIIFNNPELSTSDSGGWIIFTLVFIFSVIIAALNVGVGSVSISAATLGIIRAEKGEGSTKFMNLLRDGTPFFGRILGVILIVNLTIGLIFTLFFLLSSVLIIVTAGLASFCVQPLMILLTPLMFLMLGALEAAQTSVIEENLSTIAAVKRGIQIMREHLWKYIGITLIVYLGSSVLTSLVITPLLIPIFVAPVFVFELEQEMTIRTIIIISIYFTCILLPVMTLFSSFIGTYMKIALDLTYLRLARKADNQVIFSETNA